jgi:excisionase family DNA binding protein
VPIQDEYLTVPEVMKVAKASKSWVYNKIKSRELPCVTLPGGRMLRVPASALIALLSQTSESRAGTAEEGNVS